MNHAQRTQVDAFIDLRSPYSYLALAPARALAERAGVTFDWWPYLTDFQSAYGGEVEQRSARDIAKLKYLYMDCRRLAKLQALTIRATTKLWDATLGSKAMLFAKSHNKLWQLCDPVLKSFWQRDFDLESEEQTEAAIAAAGLSVDDWRRYFSSDAQTDLDAACSRAEQLGVFGAPTFVYRDEVFWGGDRLEMLGERLIASSAVPLG